MRIHRQGRHLTTGAALAIAATVITLAGGCASPRQGDVLATETRRLAEHVPGGCDAPAGQSAGAFGCYLTATATLGSLPDAPLFWHLATYPTRGAAEAATGGHGTVVEAFGRVWLYTIAPEGWRPRGGERVTAIGPLGISPGKQYTARYMEATFPPGMVTPSHLHAGPEAWYVLTGAQCLETPRGVTIARAGDGAMVEEGPKMALVGIGSEVRRAVLLVLHDHTQPWMKLVDDWEPKGLCPK